MTVKRRDFITICGGALGLALLGIDRADAAPVQDSRDLVLDLKVGDRVWLAFGPNKLGGNYYRVIAVSDDLDRGTRALSFQLWEPGDRPPQIDVVVTR